MDGELEALTARQAITDLIYRYCRSGTKMESPITARTFTRAMAAA